MFDCQPAEYRGAFSLSISGLFLDRVVISLFKDIHLNGQPEKEENDGIKVTLIDCKEGKLYVTVTP